MAGVPRRSRCPRSTPAIASAASLVFLFCATAFGIVLVLGGLRFGTIETEIWIQTTQFLDLRAAAVLSVVQLVVVAGALTRRRPGAVAARAGAGAHPPGGVGASAAAAPARGHAGRRRARAALVATAVTALVVLLLALPLVNLVVRSLRTADGWGLDNYAALGTTGGAR